MRIAKKKILVVDDERFLVSVLDFSLRDFGYDVITAQDGEEGIRKAKSERPDVIVCDVMMPKIDGYEMCRRLKSNSATRDVPVVFLTTKSRESDRQQGLKAGAAEYLCKPFAPEKIVETIEKVLQKPAGSTDAAG